MPTRVQMPGGKIAEFPDGMSPQDIEGALNQHFSAPPVAAGLPSDTHPAGLPAGVSLPGLPSGPNALSTRAAKDSRVPIGSALGTVENVGTHAIGLLTGTAHTVAAPPQGRVENAVDLLGPGMLPLYRSFVAPTVANAKAAIKQFGAHNAGNPMGDYDESGNYSPSGMSAAIDSIPVVGPWSRQVENDAHQHGAIPALAGLATDALLPKVAAGALSGGARAAGFGAQLSAATPESMKLAGTRWLTSGNPGELLQSALKPGVKYGAGAGDLLQKSIPSVLDADPNAKGVSGFAAAADKAREAAYEPYNNLLAPYRQPPGGIGPTRPSAINGAPIADAQMDSIPFMDTVDRPGSPTWNSWRGAFDRTGGIEGKTADVANNYRRDFSAPEVDTLRGDANAKLNAFYNKQGGDQAAALSNPETARVKAVGDAAREQLYPLLEQNAGLDPGSVAEMQQKYGLLSDASDIANKREPVFARHDPVTLSQKIVAGHGNPASMAWNYLVQNGLAKLTNSDALVDSALDRYLHPEGTPLVPRPGAIPRAVSAVGSGLRSVPSIPAAANPFYWNPKTQK